MSTPALTNDLSGLAAFVRVVEAGSFAQAARRMGQTTSGVSKAVARFERARGVRLLHRTTHSVTLTEEGDRLIDSARALLERLDEVEAALGEMAAGQGGGRVRLTAPSSFARACILPRLPAFLRANPDLQFEIKFRNELLDLAAEGVDLALRSGPLDRVPGHHARRLCAFPWIACASPDYLAARGAPSEPQDLDAHAHVGFRNPATGQILAWRFAGPRGRGTMRYAPKPAYVFDDAHASVDLVCAGFGIAWGPAWIVAERIRSGQLVEVLKPWRVPEEPLWLVRLTNRQPPQRVLRTMAFLSSLSSMWMA